MSVGVVVIGAGGFGREVLDVLEASNTAVCAEGSSAPKVVVSGIADDNPRTTDLQRLATRGIKYLGTTQHVIDNAFPQYFLVGVGNPSAKAHLARKFTDAGWRAITAVHPKASVGSSSSVGEGSVICGGVQISTNVSLGKHVHINPNATIGHDSQLHDFVSVNPGAVVSGEVEVESGTLVGAGAVILQGLRVGSNSTVGASACVVSRVKSGSTVVGVPAVEIASV